MKVLVTGGAGYIGSNAVKKLLDAGHEVVVYDDLSTGNKWAIDKRASFVEGDIRDYETLSKAAKAHKFDCVMNFAAKLIVGESVDMPIFYFDVNVTGVNNIVRVMKEEKIKNIVHSSTAATYGNPKEMPIKEDCVQIPESPYGTSKLAAEHLIIDSAKAYGFNYCIFRYFNVAGACGDLGLLPPSKITHIIPSIVMAAKGIRPELVVFGNDYDTKDGTTVRDMFHVSDLVDSHILGMDYISKKNVSDIFNLGTGTGHSILEMIKSTEKVTGLKVPYKFGPRRAGDCVTVVASNEKAKKVLGWEIKNTLEDIIQSDSDFREKFDANN